MLTLKFEGKAYPLDLKEAMESLTGNESMMVEDFLGGWNMFRDPKNLTRSTIVMLWMAKRQAGEKVTFAELAEIPGLVFSDAMTVDDDEDGQSPLSDTPQPISATPPSEPAVGQTPPLQSVSERAS